MAINATQSPFALTLDPKLQAGYYNLGLVLMAEKRAPEARAAFRRARELAPDSPFGHLLTYLLVVLPLGWLVLSTAVAKRGGSKSALPHGSAVR